MNIIKWTIQYFYFNEALKKAGRSPVNYFYWLRVTMKCHKEMNNNN